VGRESDFVAWRWNKSQKMPLLTCGYFEA